ncbi:MAG: hypothetical protein SGI71_03340 [Verrucomicrobiota bacterium]|nr:hypothetical protein [Verrucomicrobiota bacterium]
MWRLRRAETGDEFGPVEFGTLLQWSRGAQISPSDEVYNEEAGGQAWVPAASIDAFEMFFMVKLDNGTTYGPTNAYTLQEFLRSKEIRLTNQVSDLRTNMDYNVATVALNPSEAASLANPLLKKRGQVSFPEGTVPISEMIIKQRALNEGATLSGGPTDIHGTDAEKRLFSLEAELKKIKSRCDDLTQLYNQIQKQISSQR